MSDTHRRAVLRRAEEWTRFCSRVAVERQEPVDALAASEQVWSLFVAHLARRGLARRTVSAYLSSIRTWHVMSGVAAPRGNGLLGLAVRGVERNPLRAPRRAPAPPRFPLTIAVLERLRFTFDMQRLSDSALWLACLLGVCGLLRGGELALADGISEDEKARRMLRVRHVAVDERSGVLCLHVPVTKTSQTRGTDVFYARQPQGPSEHLCVLRALEHYTAVRNAARAQARRPPMGSEPQAPLLTLGVAGRRRDSEAPLSRRQLLVSLRLKLCAGGFSEDQASRFTGHSFRRGGAQSLRDVGARLEDIKRAGRWKSEAVRRYLTDPADLAASLAAYFARSAGPSGIRSARPGPAAAAAARAVAVDFDDAPSAVPLADHELGNESDSESANSQTGSEGGSSDHEGGRGDVRQVSGQLGSSVFVQLEASPEARWGEDSSESGS